MSTITTTQYIRKPLYVDAVRITAVNFEEIAVWCQGEIKQDETPGKGKKYIKVRVHNPKNDRQTRAYVGDWLLYTDRGYKIYTNKAFHMSFDVAPTGKSLNQVVAEAKEAVHGELNVDCVYDDTIDIVPATPQAIAQAVRENEAAQQAEAERLVSTGVANETDIRQGLALGDGVEETSFPVPETIEPAAAEGKRVLSIAEQKELTSDEVRELVQSGEVVLAQDIAAA